MTVFSAYVTPITSLVVSASLSLEALSVFKDAAYLRVFLFENVKV